jgi:BlaI family penicillinase repressor
MLFLKHYAAFAAFNVMIRKPVQTLSRRGRATAAEIQRELPDPPSYSAVRAKLRVLEDKGHVRHEEQALRYVYLPMVTRDKAKQSALRHLLETFFDNSAEQAITALLNLKAGGLAPDKLDRLSALIAKAKKEGI